MWNIFYIILAFACLIFILSIIWHFASKRWQLPCPAWLAWMVEADNPFSQISRAASIIEVLNLQPNMTVLDAGCGPGRVTIPLARKIGPQGTVTALDIQKGNAKKSKSKSSKSKCE